MIPNTTNGSFRPFGRFPQGVCLLGGLAAAMAAAVPTGCQSPYQRDAAEDLRRSVRAAVDREVAPWEDKMPPLLYCQLVCSKSPTRVE